MGLKKIRVFSGLSLAAGLLLSGCFGTETPQSIKKIQKVVMPSVQRLVHDNPFVKNHTEKLPDHIIPTHPVARRTGRMPLNYFLLRTGEGTICTDENEVPLASFLFAAYVDRVAGVAHQLGNPCHAGQDNLIPNFDPEGVQRQWMSQMLRKSYALYQGKLHWMLNKATPEEMVRYGERVVLSCASEDDSVGFVATQTPALDSLHQGDGIEVVWGVVAYRTEGQTYLTTRHIHVELNGQDLAVYNVRAENDGVVGQVLRPRADGTTRARLQLSKLEGLTKDQQQETQTLLCQMELNTDPLQVASE